jgi:hypothetical protein
MAATTAQVATANVYKNPDVDRTEASSGDCRAVAVMVMNIRVQKE